MLRIVTTNNTEIFRHLRSRPIQAMNVEFSIATSYQAVLELARTKRPRVVIVDAQMPGGSGYELVNEIKRDADLADIRVMLVMHSALPQREIERVVRSGCDDILCVPLRAGEFFSHMAQVLGLPYRRQQRIAYPADATLEVDGTSATVRVDDIALGGVGVTCDTSLPANATITLQLFADLPPFPAHVAWAAATDRGCRAGIAFGDLPVEARMRVEQCCLFSISADDSAPLVVSIHGRITEHSDLSPLRARLDGERRIEFDMRDVVYMSSVGVRTWCDFLRELGEIEYSFFHASIAFASQVAMVPMVVGRGTIKSLEAPYFCEQCDREDVRLLTVEAILREGDDIVPPPLHCGTCNELLVFDDLPRRYFAHLVSPSSIEP